MMGCEMNPTPPLLIFVAGPYRSNTDDDPTRIASNMKQMNQAALAIFRRGHTPITGEAIALPLIDSAGSKKLGDAIFEEIFHPIARRLIAKVDAILRVGGPSRGADEMMTLGLAHGKILFRHLDEIPPANRLDSNSNP